MRSWEEARLRRWILSLKDSKQQVILISQGSQGHISVTSYRHNSYSCTSSEDLSTGARILEAVHGLSKKKICSLWIHITFLVLPERSPTFFLMYVVIGSFSVQMQHILICSAWTQGRSCTYTEENVQNQLVIFNFIQNSRFFQYAFIFWPILKD